MQTGFFSQYIKIPLLLYMFWKTHWGNSPKTNVINTLLRPATLVGWSLVTWLVNKYSNYVRDKHKYLPVWPKQSRGHALSTLGATFLLHYLLSPAHPMPYLKFPGSPCEQKFTFPFWMLQ